MPLPRAKKRFKVDKPQHADSEYFDHALRFFALYSDIRSACVRVSVKYLDAYLLWLASHPEPQIYPLPR